MISELKFDEHDLIPVITQDAESGQVLMFAFANREALDKTLETGEAHYYSRSRQELWHKGATSGHFQSLQEIRYDCDGDAVLYRVLQKGAACHIGEYSCFHRSITSEAITSELEPSSGEVMMLLQRVIDKRLQELPEGSYVSKIHSKGLGYICQKVVEEAGETIVAALQNKREELLDEAADLLFHLTVLLRESKVDLLEVMKNLYERHKEKGTVTNNRG